MKTVLLAAAIFSLCGCDINIDHGGPVEHATQSVELDKSEMTRVDIKIGAGELDLAGGSPKLAEASFDYNIPSWKPIMRYDASSFRSQLRIEQPAGRHGGSNLTYKWNVKLNDKMPIDLMLDLGAGEARMDIGSMNLRTVQVNMGVGEIRLDLRGTPARDYSVNINGGVGHATVLLPSSVGIEANATGGIGDINVRGLEKRDGRWINPAHTNAPVTVHVDVKGGIGQIELIAE
jgi:hypothetical protein